MVLDIYVYIYIYIYMDLLSSLEMSIDEYCVKTRCDV